MSTMLIKPPSIMLDAMKVAKTSPYGRFKLGAIIAQNKKIVSIGTNRKKTHTLQARFASRPHLSSWMHAEVHALTLCNIDDAIGADIYIARILQDGGIANSKPCCGCTRALKHYGLNRMFYIQDGQFFKESINA